MRTFARAGWPEHDRVTHVADVQIQTKRRVAFGDALHQGWSERRIHWTRRLFFPSPDRARWDQVRKVKDRDIRPPDVLDAVARQTSNEGVHRIQGFDARGRQRKHSIRRSACFFSGVKTTGFPKPRLSPFSGRISLI